MARKLTDKSLEELEPQFKEQEETLKDLRDIIAGLKHKLSENAAAKERIMEKQTAIEAQKNECRRWENLHELIGSADGKKYRNFAQGLTFEMMIGHANRQLQKMTTATCWPETTLSLELNVVDNYQAGRFGPRRTFPAAKFYRQPVPGAGVVPYGQQECRVDSLFLDEAGTLDEKPSTPPWKLAGLQQDGKLMGVISRARLEGADQRKSR